MVNQRLQQGESILSTTSGTRDSLLFTHSRQLRVYKSDDRRFGTSSCLPCTIDKKTNDAAFSFYSVLALSEICPIRTQYTDYPRNDFLENWGQLQVVICACVSRSEIASATGWSQSSLQVVPSQRVRWCTKFRPQAEARVFHRGTPAEARHAQRVGKRLVSRVRVNALAGHHPTSSRATLVADTLPDDYAVLLSCVRCAS